MQFEVVMSSASSVRAALLTRRSQLVHWHWMRPVDARDDEPVVVVGVGDSVESRQESLGVGYSRAGACLAHLRVAPYRPNGRGPPSRERGRVARSGLPLTQVPSTTSPLTSQQGSGSAGGGGRGAARGLP